MKFDDIKKSIFKLTWMGIIFSQLYFLYHMIYIYSILEESNLIPIEKIDGIFQALQLQSYIILFLIACVFASCWVDILKMAKHIIIRLKNGIHQN